MIHENPKIAKIIELYSLYGTPSSVWRKLKEEFGNDAPTYQSVRDAREKYVKQIQAERKRLSKKLPLLDPSERWYYLQEIVDGALEGDLLTMKGGATKMVVDRHSALQALKLADDWSQVRGVVKPDELNTDDLVKNVVMDMLNKLKALPENKGKSIQDLISEVKESNIPETMSPFLDEILEQYQINTK